MMEEPVAPVGERGKQEQDSFSAGRSYQLMQDTYITGQDWPWAVRGLCQALRVQSGMVKELSQAFQTALHTGQDLAKIKHEYRVAIIQYGLLTSLLRQTTQLQLQRIHSLLLRHNRGGAW